MVASHRCTWPESAQVANTAGRVGCVAIWYTSPECPSSSVSCSRTYSHHMQAPCLQAVMQAQCLQVVLTWGCAGWAWTA